MVFLQFYFFVEIFNLFESLAEYKYLHRFVQICSNSFITILYVC